MTAEFKNLQKVLKEVWTNDRMADQMWSQNDLAVSWSRAKDMEMEDAVRDMRKSVNRQLMGQARFSGNEPLFGPRQTNYQMFPVQINPNLSHNPAAHKARVEEMTRSYAALKRKGKPSYRQRQKNAHTAKANRSRRAPH